MLTVSNELKNAFMQAERTIFVRIKIGNRTFDNDNVVSVEYDSGSLSGEVFAIGSTYSNSIKITFSELVEGLKELDEVTYEIGIKLADGKIEYVPMGVFVINDAIEMDRNNNKTTIECMDRMVMMGGAYVSSLNYPAAIREVALEIANKAGVQVDVTSFERLSADRIAKPEGYTYREAIGLIAQFEAGFATFNRYGKLEIRTLSDPNFAIPPDNYFSKGLVKNEVFFRLGGISCTTDESGDEVIQSGNTAGNQIILENRVMTKTLLDKIYQKIQTINYYPFSLSWQGNPVLEAGDWVEVEDLKGNKFKTPNLSYSLSFNGGLSAKSSAETVTQSDATYQYKSPLQQKIEWIHARIDAAGGNVVYEGIDEPANPKEGDLWFKIIGPDKEILIYKRRADGSLFWEPQISTADIDKVAKEVGAIINQADADRIEAEQKFDQAVTDAKAYTEQKATEFNGQLEIVRADVVETAIKTNDAVAKANQSIADVGFMQIDLNTAKANAIDALTKAQTATDNLNTLSFSVDELTKTVGFKAEKTTVDAVTRQVDQHELSIAANAREIDLRMTSTQVDSLVTSKGYVNQAQLTATSELWNVQLSKVGTDLSNLEIGTRNLLPDSNNFKNYTVYSGAVATFAEKVSVPEWGATDATRITTRGGTSSIKVYKAFVNPSKDGQEYRTAIWVKNNTNVRMLFHSNLTSTYIEAGESKRVVLSLKGNGVSNAQIQFRTNSVADSMDITVWRAMAVEGNKMPADWSPAPEDMATVEKVASLELKIDGFQVDIRDKVSMGQFNVLAGQVSSKVATADFEAAMNLQANNFNVRVSDVQKNLDGLDINDRNLYPNSGNFVSTSGWSSGVTIEQKDGFSTLKTTGGGYANTAGSIQILEPNTEYIVTAEFMFDTTYTAGDTNPVHLYVRNAAGSTLLQGGFSLVGGARVLKANTWETVSVRFKTANTTDPLYLKFHLYTGTTHMTKWLKTVKVQKGNRYTGWSPAPEDMADKASLISQINISPEAILIASKKIMLDGQVNMNDAFVKKMKVHSLDAVYADVATLRTKILITDSVTAGMVKADAGLFDKVFINDAVVQKLTAKNSFINSIKAVEITADKVNGGIFNAANMNVVNFNANSITSGTIKGAKSNWNLNTGVLQFSGTYTSNWDGVSRVRDIDTILENGMLRIRNVPDHQTLYFSNNGISTMIDGSGLIESSEPSASGTLQFFDSRYGTTRGVTLQSHMGSVALRTTATYQNIVLDSSNEVDINLKSSENYLNVSGRIRSEGYTHKSGQVNAYIGAQEEVRITNRDLWNSGNTAYQRMRASIGYFNGVEANKYNDAYFFYIGAPTEVRVVDSFDNKGVYKPIRASDIHVNSVIANTVNDAANLYLGASSETRIVNTAGYNNGNPIYNRFRASVGYVNGIQVNRLNGGNFLYLGTPDEVRVVDGFDTNGTYRPIRATNFYQSSSREYKTNILSFDRTATDILNDLTVVEYNLKADLERGINRKELGFIAEDSPAIATDDFKAINSYKTSTLAVKAIQELSQRVKNLEQEIKQLKGAA